MDDIINFISGYKRLYKKYPSFVVCPEHAGKTLYIMGDDVGDLLPIREYPVTFANMFAPPSTVASTMPPLEIPIIAEEPGAITEGEIPALSK